MDNPQDDDSQPQENASQQQPVQNQQNQQASQQKSYQQPQGPTWKSKLKEFSKECWRVLRVTKKPDKTEFQTFVKVSGIGILIIGFIGFLIHLVKELFLV